MRKSGLQKEIASIFNNVSMPQTGDQPKPLPVQQQARDAVRPNSADAAESPKQRVVNQQPQTTQTSDVQPETDHTPAVSTLRPDPLPKTTIKPPRQKIGQNFGRQLKKVVYGSSEGQMDSRQKKMTILVGLLTVVFAGVLIVTLGGLGRKKAAPVKPDPARASSTKTVQSQILQKWRIPEPLPAELRDPMRPQAGQTEADAAAASGQMIVKGIVYSRDNPSAIVDGEIVREGQTVNGVKIVAISKDSVEFEKDGRRWTQHVQR